MIEKNSTNRKFRNRYLYIKKMYKLEILEEVESRIIEERNKECKEIERDVTTLNEIMFDLSHMLGEQGQSIEMCVTHVEDTKENIEEAVIHLEKSVEYDNQNKKIIKSVVLVAGGLSLGALGFIAGPLIGIATLLTGAVTGTGIAFLTK